MDSTMSARTLRGLKSPQRKDLDGFNCNGLKELKDLHSNNHVIHQIVSNFKYLHFFFVLLESRTYLTQILLSHDQNLFASTRIRLRDLSQWSVAPEIYRSKILRCERQRAKTPSCAVWELNFWTSDKKLPHINRLTTAQPTFVETFAKLARNQSVETFGKLTYLLKHLESLLETNLGKMNSQTSLGSLQRKRRKAMEMSHKGLQLWKYLHQTMHDLQIWISF